MKVAFTPAAWDEYVTWQEQDMGLAAKINALIESARRTPFGGIGKPEPLKGALTGYWSRRITGEHRLVYRIVGSGTEQTIAISACRRHYSR